MWRRYGIKLSSFSPFRKRSAGARETDVMPILIHCPDCGAKIRAPEQAIGRQIRCPKCDAEFTAKNEEVPAPLSPPEPAPPPPEPVAVGVAPPLPEREEPLKPERLESVRRELPPEDDEGDEDEDEKPKPAYAPGEFSSPTNPLV